MSSDNNEPKAARPPKWSMGVLNDKETDEVPGSILLMSKAANRNEPLGLRHAPARRSASSLPSPFPAGAGLDAPSQTPPVAGHASASEKTAAGGGDFFSHTPDPASSAASAINAAAAPVTARSALTDDGDKKRTRDGAIILEPQPDDSANDPLNWAAWRRDVALLSLGFYCALGGGMTPVLAAGFTDVAATFDVTIPQVALTTGFYMLGLGLGSVVASPTAILYGKRPVYLAGAALFIATSAWCAASNSYASLVVGRIFMGVSVSPVECLPSATIAEIFFLHERAYRLGIYTLLLLGGKNLIPVVSAAITQALGWRWVFWVIAITVGVSLALLFFFVPETFWDRAPQPKKHHIHQGLASTVRSAISHVLTPNAHKPHMDAINAHMEKDPDAVAAVTGPSKAAFAPGGPGQGTIAQRRQQRQAHHVGFADVPALEVHDAPEAGHAPPESGEAPQRTGESEYGGVYGARTPGHNGQDAHLAVPAPGGDPAGAGAGGGPARPELLLHRDSWRVAPSGQAPRTPAMPNFNSPSYPASDGGASDSAPTTGTAGTASEGGPASSVAASTAPLRSAATPATADPEAAAVQPSTPVARISNDARSVRSGVSTLNYTRRLQGAPPKTFAETLRPWHGRLRRDSWLRVALRPFILFAYPAVLWSTLVYSLSIGWLIVLSEAVAEVYRSEHTYHFSALAAGLVYLSPFVGGVLGTAVAGKVSDVVVRAMARRNDGVYEPEFRLVMAAPVLLTTCVGLMGFGWSAEVRDAWIVPTVFFGVISFGCSLGSTTAITFCVDSYRQYAGEALVTLNFSKNVFHGFVFSLFFAGWLEADGPKDVFLVIGGIQIACLLTTIPMYIYGKRLRMWTVRKNMMERF